MTDTIRPALTPGQWTHLEFGHGSRDMLFGFIASASPAEEENPSQRTGPLRLAWNGEMSKATTPKARHALAALALHGLVVDGKPVGFTREDVAMLRDLGCCPYHDDACEALAARIEALLPPEVTP